MYRTIDTSIWNDPRIHKLDCTAKLLAVYMFSNDRAHVTGLYFFSIALACDELGIDVTKIRKALKQLIEVNFCQHDSERRVIWIRNMWKRQPHAGVHLNRLQDHFKALNGTPLVGAFLSKYPHLKQYVTNLHELGTNQNESALQEIEQEIEQEQDKNPPYPPKRGKPRVSHILEDIKAELEKVDLPKIRQDFPNKDINATWEEFYECCVSGTAKKPWPNPYDYVDFGRGFLTWVRKRPDRTVDAKKRSWRDA